MNSIAKDQNNLGGIAKVWLIPSSLISSILYDFPFPSPELPYGWGDDSWEFTPVFQSASYTQEQQQSAAGAAWENTVSFKIPKISYESRIFTSLLAHSKWSILLLDENGQYLIMGSDDYPMRAVTKSSTGADLADFNNI